jgi:hypothetical protein
LIFKHLAPGTLFESSHLKYYANFAALIQKVHARSFYTSRIGAEKGLDLKLRRENESVQS